jgi:hypothetical protein
LTLRSEWAARARRHAPSRRGRVTMKLGASSRPGSRRASLAGGLVSSSASSAPSTPVRVPPSSASSAPSTPVRVPRISGPAPALVTTYRGWA